MARNIHPMIPVFDRLIDVKHLLKNNTEISQQEFNDLLKKAKTEEYYAELMTKMLFQLRLESQ